MNKYKPGMIVCQIFRIDMGDLLLVREDKKNPSYHSNNIIWEVKFVNGYKPGNSLSGKYFSQVYFTNIIKYSIKSNLPKWW